MLAFLLRGVVLVIVLSWYSTSIWKMIDGYFKDRFDKYLREEFAKNPRMKADMAHPGKVPPQELLDTCQLDACPVDKVVTIEEDKIAMAAVNEGQTNQENPENMSEISPDGDIPEKQEVNKGIDEKAQDLQKTKTKVKKKILPIQESKKRKKVKTITLTADDFQQAKRKMAIDEYDFAEFDYDEPPPEGILVSKLGFKPKADIGNLDRVTEDEFCPISLDYDGDCSETKIWP